MAVLRPPRFVSIIQSFLKASSSSFCMQIRPLHLLRILCFRNFSLHAHAPPLKTPLPPSPACFNRSIIFDGLLLQLSGAIPPRQSLRTVRFRNSTHCHHPPVKRRCRAGDSPDGYAEPSRRRHRIANGYAEPSRRRHRIANCIELQANFWIIRCMNFLVQDNF